MSVSVSWLRKETHSSWKALLISIFARLEQNKNKNKNLHSSERQQVENEGSQMECGRVKEKPLQLMFEWMKSKDEQRKPWPMIGSRKSRQ